MAPIAWKPEYPEYGVGDLAIHPELVNAAAILDPRPEADPDRSLGDLGRAVPAHSAQEERQMRRTGSAAHPPHKAGREHPLDRLRDIMDGTGAVADRLTSVEARFTDHVRTHEARLHRSLGAHGP